MRLTHEDLAARTLARQFPPVTGRDAAAVLELFRRLGPIQSQVPRSPFVTASSRLPGVDYTTVQGLFASQHLLKTSSLRGTVHTSGREHYPGLDAVARRGRAGVLRSQLRLQRVTPEQVTAELEAYADAAWRTRAEIVAHGRAWLTAHESASSAAAVTGTFGENLLWGHSGLLRRPKDERWEKRTDIYHRRARSLVPELGEVSAADGLTEVVRTHLAALGPATRQDLAYFSASPLGAVDAALARLGEEVLHLEGPDGEPFLDLAEAPVDAPETGVRLLPEFDALLVGYCGRYRTRFLDADQLQTVWAKVNGQFAPAVLAGGRIVGTWRTLARRSRTEVEVTMLAPHRPLAEEALAPAVAALATVLELSVEVVRVLPAPP